MVMEHTLPLLTSLIEFIINGWRFQHKHVVFCILFGITYAVVNLIGTLARDEPIYPIITWDEWLTAAYIAGIINIRTKSFVR